MLLYARRLRAYVAEGLHGWAFLLALALVAVALTLVVDGNTVFGCAGLLLAIPVTWLGGIWVTPWGEDAYARAMRDVIRTGPAEANHADRRRHDQMRRLTTTITELEPPQQLVELHRRVVGCMREIDRLETDHGVAPEDRAVRMYELRRELSRLLDDVTADGASGSYLLRLKRGVEDLIRTSTRDTVQATFQRRSERLVKIRPPQRWRDRHDRSVKIFSDYFSALPSYYASLKDGDIDAIRDAAKMMAVRHEELTRFTEDYLQELGEQYTGQSLRGGDRGARRAVG